MNFMHKENIFIRPLEESDIPTTTNWMNDTEISDSQGFLPVFNLKDQLEWYKRISSDKTRYIFAICNNTDARHIGNVALGNIDYIHRHCMFSIFIYDSNNRGKGYGIEATELALIFAFNKLNLNKVYLRVSEKSVRAIKMYENIGFVKEGVMRQHYYSNGKYEDKIFFSILKSEFCKSIKK